MPSTRAMTKAKNIWEASGDMDITDHLNPFAFVQEQGTSAGRDPRSVEYTPRPVTRKGSSQMLAPRADAGRQRVVSSGGGQSGIYSAPPHQELSYIVPPQAKPWADAANPRHKSRQQRTVSSTRHGSAHTQVIIPDVPVRSHDRSRRRPTVSPVTTAFPSMDVDRPPIVGPYHIGNPPPPEVYSQLKAEPNTNHKFNQYDSDNDDTHKPIGRPPFVDHSPFLPSEHDNLRAAENERRIVDMQRMRLDAQMRGILPRSRGSSITEDHPLFRPAGNLAARQEHVERQLGELIRVERRPTRGLPENVIIPRV